MPPSSTVQLQRKENAVLRCLKDVAMYFDDVARDRKELEQMISVNHDRIKQQQTVVQESENMITVAQNQTTKMIDDLEQFIRSIKSAGLESSDVLTSEIAEFLVKLSAFTPKSDQQTRDIERLTCLLTTFGSDGATTQSDESKIPFC